MILIATPEEGYPKSGVGEKCRSQNQPCFGVPYR